MCWRPTGGLAPSPRGNAGSRIPEYEEHDVRIRTDTYPTLGPCCVPGPAGARVGPGGVRTLLVARTDGLRTLIHVYKQNRSQFIKNVQGKFS